MRTFLLENGIGETWDIMANSYENPSFFKEPSGLGFERENSYRRAGARFILVTSQHTQAVLSGTVLFLNTTRFNEREEKEPYEIYQKFLRFLGNTPLTIIYTPYGERSFRRSVAVTKIEKTEKEDKYGILECPIEFAALGPWYETIKRVSDPFAEEATGFAWEKTISSDRSVSGQTQDWVWTDATDPDKIATRFPIPVGDYEPISELTDGMSVWIFFPNPISTDGATLKLEETDAKPIYYNGAPITAGIVDGTETYCKFTYNQASDRWNLEKVLPSARTLTTWGVPGTEKKGIIWGSSTTMTLNWTSDSYIDSPCRIKLYGPVKNPTWTHYANGVLQSTGALKNITIPKNNYLMIDNTKDPYTIAAYDKDGNMYKDCYQNSDFATERFIFLKNGSNSIIVTNNASENSGLIKIEAEAFLYYESV